MTAFLPAGLSLDDLLQAAEDMQRHLPSPGGEGPPGGGFAGDDAPNAYTPLDLASLLAAHAHRLRQESEKRQALRAAEEVLASRLGLPGPGLPVCCGLGRGWGGGGEIAGVWGDR